MSSNAVAEWVAIERTPPGYAAFATFTIYADSTTMLKEGNISTILFLSDYKSSQVGSSYSNFKPYLSIKAQGEFDCEKKQNRVLSLLFYPEKMGGGEAVNMSGGGAREIDTKKWYPIPPYGHIFDMLMFACGK